MLARFSRLRRIASLSIFFTALAAALLIGLASTEAGAQRPALPEPDAIEGLIKREIEAFRAAMQSGDFKTLYEHGSRAFRDSVKLNDVETSLRPMVGAFEPLSIVAPLKPTYSEPPRIDDQGKLILRGRFDAPDRVVTFTIDMVQDAGAWRFLNINVNHDAPEKAAAPREPVPEAERLPMPSPDRVEELLRTHLAMFAEATGSGDFAKLHAAGSRAVQAKSTAAEMSEGMKILRGKFEPLVTIGSLPAKHTMAPHIDATGRLILRGFFETKPMVSRYSLDFVPEGGDWRFEDISVRVVPADAKWQALPDAAALEALVKREIAAFHAAMQSGDFATLHARGAKAFRDNVKIEDMKKNLGPLVGSFEPLALAAALKPIYSEPPHIDDNGTLILHGDFDAASHIIKFTIDMARDEGDWRFVNLNAKYDSKNDGPATPVEPIPEGQRLPLPEPGMVEELLRSHIAAFGKAVMQGAFEALHAMGAKSVRDKNPIEKFREAWKPLQGKFGALDSIGALEPVYAEPPHIDDNGRLILRGHFATEPKKTEFSIDLIPEDGAWRFENLSVNLK